MPTPRPTPFPLRRWLALALGVVGCVGTPTPEPPDALPRPQISIIAVATDARETVSLLPPIEFRAPAGAVGASNDVWIVNLDRPSDEPTTVRAAADGSFAVTITGAQSQDRIRIVARDQERHSLPVDLQVVEVPGGGALSSLAPDMLGCLTIEPEDVTVVVGASSVTRRFVLANGCDEEVAIERAALRLGAEDDFALGAPPARVPAGTEVALEVIFEGRRTRGLRTDIVLLDLATDRASSHRALGVWSLTAADL